jgi:hypothetical protein
MIHDGHKSCAAVEGERYYWHVLYIPVGRHCHTIPMALLACDGTASPMCGEATPAYQLECCCCLSVLLHYLDAELECCTAGYGGAMPVLGVHLMPFLRNPVWQGTLDHANASAVILAS